MWLRILSYPGGCSGAQLLRWLFRRSITQVVVQALNYSGGPHIITDSLQEGGKKVRAEESWETEGEVRVVRSED